MRWDLIRTAEDPAANAADRQAWDMVGHAINTWKDDLLKARIRGMWFSGAKPSGGKLLLGKMKVYGARDRRVLQADGEIQLNLDWWTHELTTDAQRLALVHHELCHMGRKIVRGQPDEEKFQAREIVRMMVDGEWTEEERLLWRVVKHDVEEFGAVVEHHGLWIGHVASFAASIAAGMVQLDLPGVERGRPAILTPAMMAEIKAGLERIGEEGDVSVSFRTH